MSRLWLTSIFRKSPGRPAGPRFAPRVSELEARDVPATFYVDPAATAGNPVFNAGRPDQYTGTFGSDVFNDLRAAITRANAAPNAGGPDVIRLAHTPDIFFVASPANTAVAITESVNVVGAGAGASVIQTSSGVDQTGAVLTVDGNPAAPGAVAVNFSDVTFHGGAGGFLGTTGTVGNGDTQTGVFVRYRDGAVGTVARAVFTGIYADAYEGFGAAAFGAGTALTIEDSTFGSIGRVGAAATGGAVLNLYGNTYVGKGAGPFLDVFAQYTNGATGVVSGNTVTGNSGIVGTDASAALLVSRNGGAAASVTAFGNAFSRNAIGVSVGDSPADGSTATLRYNNIVGNLDGVVANPATGPAIDAANTFWGDPSGPFNPATNPTGLGNGVPDRVAARPFAVRPNPVLAAPTLAEYLARAFPPTTPAVTVTAAADATPTAPGAFTFTRTGGDPARPLTVTYAVGGSAVPGTNYTALPGSITIPAGQPSATVTFAALPGSTEARTVTVTLAAGTDYVGTGTPASATVTGPPVPRPPARLVGYREYAAGADAGGAPVATLFNPDGTARLTRTPFAADFAGGARVAAGDVTGDAVADLIVGTGPGAVTRVVVYDGATGQVLADFQPFEAGFTGGVHLAAGDVTGDGRADVVVTPDQGGGGRVVVFNGNGFGVAASFEGIQDPAFRGGARAAVGDVNGDGRADVVVAAGFGGGPRVAFYDGRTLATAGGPAKLVNDIFVFEQTLRNGVFVAAGDVNGDGRADPIFGGGPGGGPRVIAVSGAELLAGRAEAAPLLVNFFAGSSDNRGGIRVAAKDLDGDNQADLVVGAGQGAGDRVTGYRGRAFAGGTAPEAFAFSALGGFAGGVFVG